MDFAIARVVAYDGVGPLKAFCDVAVGNTVMIKSVRIIEGRSGLFISMPRQQNRGGKWFESIVPLTREARIKLSRAVLDAYLAHARANTISPGNGGSRTSLRRRSP